MSTKEKSVTFSASKCRFIGKIRSAVRFCPVRRHVVIEIKMVVSEIEMAFVNLSTITTIKVKLEITVDACNGRLTDSINIG